MNHSNLRKFVLERNFCRSNPITTVSEIWNRVYSDASFFGDDPSNFGLECYEVRKILELGCGNIFYLIDAVYPLHFVLQ
jgi:hypothetical protein